jgi:hypothetical protein
MRRIGKALEVGAQIIGVEEDARQTKLIRQAWSDSGKV